MSGVSTYTEEVGEAICDLIAQGISLRNICSRDGMPGLTTARRWLAAHETFRLQYAHARDEQADYYADDIIDIADTEEDPNKARVRIDARKWKASKLAPKKYGDKLDLNHGGEMKVVLTAEDDDI